MTGQTPPGPAVDALGHPAVDPTANVLLLVEAAVKRQDDLRANDQAHIRELLDVREHYTEKLAAAESNRIDAIRAVDVGAVQRAAEVSAIQASTLAAQVATSAETLRGQVAAAASASVVGLGAALEPIIKDVADLRRSQYELAGQRANVVETRTDSRGGSMVGIAVVSAVLAFISITATVIIALTR